MTIYFCKKDDSYITGPSDSESASKNLIQWLAKHGAHEWVRMDEYAYDAGTAETKESISGYTETEKRSTTRSGGEGRRGSTRKGYMGSSKGLGASQ